ncbi:MAG: class I SAM-dependent methyltransferase [Solirubrobacteraceae bacterium]
MIWHDLECGAYSADIPLWLELAAEVEGPVLEIGAGTGRIALELAAAGHEVHAVERDAQLAAELRRRGRGLPLRAICADAEKFECTSRFELVIVPMQTLHLMERPEACLGCVRRAMLSGGRLAAALLGEGITPFREELEADET